MLDVSFPLTNHMQKLRVTTLNFPPRLPWQLDRFKAKVPDPGAIHSELACSLGQWGNIKANGEEPAGWDSQICVVGVAGGKVEPELTKTRFILLLLEGKAQILCRK